MTVGGDIMAVVFGFCFVTLYFYVAFRVAKHAKESGRNWLLHGVLTIIFSLVYAGLYFIMNADNSEARAAQ